MTSPLGHPRSRELPMELVSLILRELDKSSLAQCTLVCRDWLELSRPYLFETITYRAHNLHYPSTCPDVPLPLDDVLQFLSSSPSVCRLVRHLTLSTKKQYWALLFHMEGRANLAPCRWQTLIKLLRLLPRLRTLELANFPLESLNAAFDARPLYDAPVIERLEAVKFARQCHASDRTGCFREVLHLLSIFKQIDRLAFGAFTSPTVDHAPLASRVKTQVRSLTVPPHVSTLLRSIPLLPTWSHLRCLTLPVLPPEDVSYCLRLLNLARASLRRVEFCIPRIEQRGPTIACLQDLKLASCPRLESIAIAIPLYGVSYLLNSSIVNFGRPYFDAPAYAFIADLISACSAPLRTIAFNLQPDLTPFESRQFVQPDMLQTDWSALDDILSRRVDEGLTSVQFRDASQNISQIPDAVQRYFARTMPRLWGKGVAHFI